MSMQRPFSCTSSFLPFRPNQSTLLLSCSSIRHKPTGKLVSPGDYKGPCSRVQKFDYPQDSTMITHPKRQQTYECHRDSCLGLT